MTHLLPHTHLVTMNLEISDVISMMMMMMSLCSQKYYYHRFDGFCEWEKKGSSHTLIIIAYINVYEYCKPNFQQFRGSLFYLRSNNNNNNCVAHHHSNFANAHWNSIFRCLRIILSSWIYWNIWITFRWRNYGYEFHSLHISGTYLSMPLWLYMYIKSLSNLRINAKLWRQARVNRTR